MSLPLWARAHGGPLFAAAIRTRPEDFQVTEELGWEFSGDGEHDYLWIEKTSANTEWVGRQLAKHAGVPAKDVGFAGLKDRHAITRQWYSVPRWHAPDWSALDVEGASVLDVQRHNRKLRRGAHRANAFRIVLRCDDAVDTAACEDRVALLRTRGVPNYFGPQRFGRNGANVSLADRWAAGARLPRHKRGIAISSARSYCFNEALDARVTAGTWDQIIAGDKANLAGTASVFDVADVDAELERRCREMDIHPAGELPGDGSEIANGSWQQALAGARVDPAWRALRLPVPTIEAEIEADTVTLSFSLVRGAFATSVLRELSEVRDGVSD